MWFWLISAIAGSILGNAVDSWFSETKLGIWFYGKVTDILIERVKKLKYKYYQEKRGLEEEIP